MKKHLSILAVLVIVIVFSCKKDTTNNDPIVPPANTKFTLSSPAFVTNGKLPVKYTVDEKPQPVFPPLVWTNVPAKTKQFILVMDDPDNKPLFGYATVNWLMFNIDDTVRSIKEGVNFYFPSPSGAIMGANTLGQPQYGPPSPPNNVTHHYSIRLYAADMKFTTLGTGAKYDQVWKAAQGHLIDSASMMVEYY